ncbi:hypothetical protein KKA14_15005, partial [bacterium]|nr:hypothetical protein [bacterium]
AGNYLMRLIYSSAIGEDLVEESTVIMESKDQERCQHGGRDINLVDVTIGDSVFHRIFRFFENKLNIKFLKRWLGKFKNWCGIKNSVQLNLEFKVKGFDNSFRKPLVRVPVIIEIKNGPTVLRQIEYELLLPETTGDETFVTDIWMPYKFFKEDANLIVRIPQRDDENIASNNSKTITIE